jgi:hypothetical protein
VLQLLDHHDSGAEGRRRLGEALRSHLDAVLASRGDSAEAQAQVSRAEAEVKADPRRAIRFDDAGRATIHAHGRSYRGGRFELPRLGELRERALAARARQGPPAARVRLFVLDGVSPATDIGALQAFAPPDSLFQVASQFNCLESPGPYVVDVVDYLSDPTQGPRASISAFPGTLVRHYAAPRPDGTRFVQTTAGSQLNLLADVCEPGGAAVHSGYLRASDIADPHAFARALTERLEAVRIGLHDGVEVVLGYDWTGSVSSASERTIAQVFTSTLAAGLYGGLGDGDPSFTTICRQLQRAAYLGTLLGAAALGKTSVALTLIGGGVFGNPLPLIWDALLWAVDEVDSVLGRELIVAVNGRNLGSALPAERLAAAASARGGALIRFTPGGITVEGG